MKLSKKLIAAIGMLTLSAVMLVTSSFAWFSMNEKVSANGMIVTAKGDQVYLQIVNAETAFVAGSAQTAAQATTYHGETVGEETKEVALLPTNVVKSISNGSIVDYDGGKDFAWVTNIGKAPNDGDPVDDSKYTDVTTAANQEYNNYVLKNTFKVRLDPTAGAEVASGALKIETINLTTTVTEDYKKCLSVFVVSTIGGNVKGAVYDYETGDFVLRQDSSDVLSADPFTNAEATIDVYVFFNGESEFCTLANLTAALTKTFAIDITFTVAE